MTKDSNTATIPPNGDVIGPRETKLLLVLAAIIIASAAIAELVAVKLFEVPIYRWFGSSKMFVLTAGSLVWPLVFLTTDTINEFFGRKAVRFISWLAAAMIVWMFIIVNISIAVPAAPWCEVKLEKNAHYVETTEERTTAVLDETLPPETAVTKKIPMDKPFRWIFGQSIWIIIGSLAAFLLSQLVDVSVFHFIRRRLKGRFIWARATGSTIVSQLIDSFVVIYIAFWLPGYVPGANPSQAYDAARCFDISKDSFTYKVGFAILLTPLIYLAHWIVTKWLGAAKAHALAENAARTS